MLAVRCALSRCWGGAVDVRARPARERIDSRWSASLVPSANPSFLNPPILVSLVLLTDTSPSSSSALPLASPAFLLPPFRPPPYSPHFPLAASLLYSPLFRPTLPISSARSPPRRPPRLHSDWPTIPQVYLSGEFLGGCDILLSMHSSGELEELLVKEGVIPEEVPAEVMAKQAEESGKKE